MENIKINGRSLAFEWRGRGTPLIMLHGYPLDHSIWNDVARLLEKDFEITLPDVRGFGESAVVDTPYGMSDLADDFVSLLDQLKLEQVALAGHSMGGYIALAFAKKYPERLSGLALIASQAAADTPERKEGRYKTATEVMEKGVGIVVDAMTDKLSPSHEVREFIRPLIGKQNAAGVSGALKAMAEREDLTAILSTFQFPLVLIHGTSDELIPIDRAREIKSLVPAANLFELSGVGHMPMMEAPESTAEALRLLK